jgi:hypothetical protein
VADRPARLDTLIRVLGVLSGLAMAALVLSLAGWITGQPLTSELLTAPPRSGPGQPGEQPHENFSDRQSLPAVRERPVTETPKASTARLSPARPANEPASAEGPASANSVSPRAPSPRASSDETGAPAKAGADESASSGRSRFNATMRPAPKPSVTSQQPTSAPPAKAATPDDTPTQSGGPYRAELMRAPVSRGWGDSYAVRLLDSSGQPVTLSGVLLVAQMADGSVENIAMGALPEAGMYRGTVPTGRSTPVDLRVRVRIDDKFIEIPLTPQ